MNPDAPVSHQITSRTVLRTVSIVVLVVLTLWLIYVLRTPLSWLVIATFIAVAVSGPVNALSRHMKRGLAIAIVYLIIAAIPFVLGALLIPPIVDQIGEFADNAPQYADDLEEFVNENQTFQDVDKEFDVTGKVQEEASQLPSRVGDAAGILQDIGVGLVNSVFAAFTILILSIFMVAGGRRWVESFLSLQSPEQGKAMGQAMNKSANAVGNYIGGALLQATLAGIAAFVLLSIIGAPFPALLALIIAAFDLIPVVGATIGAALVATVVLFVNFPIALIIWIIFAIVYQQFENYVIQPQIQRRAVEIEPFVTLVAVLFGATLFGVVGALLAIPAAASVQITAHEFMAYRRELAGEEGGEEPATPEAPPPPPGTPAEGTA
jgi:predicted PurR-regulated permease PerM